MCVVCRLVVVVVLLSVGFVFIVVLSVGFVFIVGLIVGVVVTVDWVTQVSVFTYLGLSQNFATLLKYRPEGHRLGTEIPLVQVKYLEQFDGSGISPSGVVRLHASGVSGGIGTLSGSIHGDTKLQNALISGCYKLRKPLNNGHR